MCNLSQKEGTEEGLPMKLHLMWGSFNLFLASGYACKQAPQLTKKQGKGDNTALGACGGCPWGHGRPKAHLMVP